VGAWERQYLDRRSREFAIQIVSFLLILKKFGLMTVVVVIHIMGRGSFGQRLLARAADGDSILRC
jgi:hypothetical protein